MRRRTGEAFQWAVEQFSGAALGDRRRTDRLVLTACAAAEAPDGCVSDVFSDAGEMHGAYDFLESQHVSASQLMAAIGDATARRCAGLPFAYTIIDGSSLTLTDSERAKGFGAIGSGKSAVRGLKVISALAVDEQGTTIGLLSQTWWCRPDGKKKSAAERQRLRTEEKEIRYWVDAINDASKRCAAHHVRPWFVIDREGDARPILLALNGTGHAFTVRSSWDRAVEATGKDQPYLRATLEGQQPACSYRLDVTEGPNRTKRTAHMVLRVMRVTLRLKDKRTKRFESLPLTAVWVREEGTTPNGERPIDWLLYTNQSVNTCIDAIAVVDGYAKRWRIEEFHKTWKSGACNVERTQLRSVEAAMKWATILAAVATRIERLKLLSRNHPDQPATTELSSDEIRILVVLARDITKRNERAPTALLTIGEATYWIARLGGYTGKSSGGPPGSITLRRGLERLRLTVAGVRAMGALDD